MTYTEKIEHVAAQLRKIQRMLKTEVGKAKVLRKIRKEWGL